MKHSLLIGRYQPFHEGHAAMVDTLLAEGKHVCIALRDTPLDASNPYTTEERQEMIRARYGDRVKVIVVPDIEEVVYGRDVGYGIRQLHFGTEIESISATKIRAQSR